MAIPKLIYGNTCRKQFQILNNLRKKTICTWLGSRFHLEGLENWVPRSTNIFPTFWCYTQKNLVCSIAIYNIFVGVAPCPKWLVSPKSQMDCCSPDPHDHQISILLKAAASVSILVHGLQAARFRDGDSKHMFEWISESIWMIQWFTIHCD